MPDTAPMLMNLPPEIYTDAGVFARERQRIFRTHWQMLGPAAQVAEPGQYVAAEIAGWKVFALRGKDGVLRAFHNVCRHRGARLLPEGTGQCDLLQCPYHLWVYDETGALRRAPWFGEDPGFRMEDWPLQPISVTLWRGLLFVAIAPEHGLEEQLGDLPAELAETPMETFGCVAERRFTMQSNWKTYTDNFVEGYHIPGIHPSFIKVIEFGAFEAAALNGLVRMTAPQKGGSIYGGKWLWMWPNWTLSTFPGGMNTSRINPISETVTELVYHFYFADRGDASEDARARTIEVNCGIVREDFEVCEHTQRNYASGAYAPGPLSPRHEKSVAYFQRKVSEAVS
jgi:choline monooxygenase